VLQPPISTPSISNRMSLASITHLWSARPTEANLPLRLRGTNSDRQPLGRDGCSRCQPGLSRGDRHRARLRTPLPFYRGTDGSNPSPSSEESCELPARFFARCCRDALVSLSSKVLPVIREYERSMTTALNAQTMPDVSSCVAQLEGRQDSGYLWRSPRRTLLQQRAKRADNRAGGLTKAWAGPISTSRMT
jgi:hypothetical protein